MKCNKCGRECRETANFCNRCGNQLKETTVILDYLATKAPHAKMLFLNRSRGNNEPSA